MSIDADEGEQPPGTPKPTTTDSGDEDSGLPEDTEHSEMQPGEEKKASNVVMSIKSGGIYPLHHLCRKTRLLTRQILEISLWMMVKITMTEVKRDPWMAQM